MMNEDTDNLQRDVGKSVEILLDEGWSPRLIQQHTKINYRKFYRWAGAEGFFAPSLSDCKKLLKFMHAVVDVKKDAVDVVAGWKNKYHEASKLGIFTRGSLKVLEDPDLNFDAKVIALTIAIFKEWGRVKGAK